MAYTFYLFGTSSWTETVPGRFFTTSPGTERLIGQTPGQAGETIKFNGYSQAKQVTISGNTLSDSASAGGTLTAPVSLNNTTYNAASGTVELDLGFVVRDAATNTYYFVGYVTVGNAPVGSVVSRGWSPNTPGVWQDGPPPGATLTLVDVTTASPAGNPFRNNVTALGGRFSSSNFNPFSNDVVLSSGITGLIDDPTDQPCFAAGTLILTKTGPVAVEALKLGDLVLTADHGYQPLRWIGSSAVDSIDLALKPSLRPIRIRKDALGQNKPSTDLLVSPQHRILVGSDLVEQMFDVREALVAAKHLLTLDGIDIVEDVENVTYYHLMFDTHEVIFSNGAMTESLFIGPQALKSLSAAAIDEIFAIFPDLRDLADETLPDAARLLLSGKQGRQLAEQLSIGSVSVI